MMLAVALVAVLLSVRSCVPWVKRIYDYKEQAAHNRRMAAEAEKCAAQIEVLLAGFSTTERTNSYDKQQYIKVLKCWKYLNYAFDERVVSYEV
jgi:hypothetical protein